jgi:hypothetical protein
VVAREARESVLDVGRVADLAHLAVAQEVDTERCLLRDHVGDRRCDCRVEHGSVVGLAVLLLIDQCDQVGAAGQAADVRSEDSIDVVRHPFALRRAEGCAAGPIVSQAI